MGCTQCYCTQTYLVIAALLVALLSGTSATASEGLGKLRRYVSNDEFACTDNAVGCIPGEGDEDQNDFYRTVLMEDASFCSAYRSCSHIQEVSVGVMPINYNSLQRSLGMRKVNSFRGRLQSGGVRFIRDGEGMRGVFTRAAQNCRRIKSLIVLSDGREGAAVFGGHEFNVDLIFRYRGYSCAMAQDATVRFEGSGIGKGCRGKHFLHAFASSFLRKGGSVEADRGFLRSNHKLTIQTGWRRARWENSISYGQCLRDLLDEDSQARRVYDQARQRCRGPNWAQRNADYLRDTWDATHDAVKAYMHADRLRFPLSHGRSVLAFRKYYTAYFLRLENAGYQRLRRAVERNRAPCN